MSDFEKGEIVGRKSYKGDILFKIADIFEENGKKHALLRGIGVRLCAHAPLEDLEKMESHVIREYRHKFIKENNEALTRVLARQKRDRENFYMRNSQKGSQPNEVDFFEMPGKVLHLDGDGEYLDLCLTTYKQLGIEGTGLAVPEEKQPYVVYDLLKKYNPDILVLTGHDGLKGKNPDFADIASYHHSKDFIEAVKNARKYEKSKDELIIFAGACQSHYEAILKAGANYASSPQRVFIHAFDPVFVVEKIAFSSIHDTVSSMDVIANTITGESGVGGIETRGKFRLGCPKSPY